MLYTYHAQATYHALLPSCKDEVIKQAIYTAWKVSKYGVFSERIFPYPGKTPYFGNFSRSTKFRAPS